MEKMNDQLIINDLIRDINKKNTRDCGNCLLVCKKILNVMEQGIIFNSIFITNFCTYITKEHYGGIGSWNKSPPYIAETTTKNIVIECLIKLALYFDLSDLSIRNMVNVLITKYNVSFFVQILYEAKENMDSNLLDAAIKLGSIQSVSEIIKYYPDFVNLGVLKRAINCGHLDLVNDMINMRITIDASIVDELLKKNTPQNFDIFKNLFLHGLKMSTEILEIACKYINEQVMHYLLENKIQPNKQCFDAIVNSMADNNIGYRYKSKQNNIPQVSKKTELINIITNFGYNLTYDDILYATRCKVVIKNIENYNIKFDNRFIEICSEIGFYPDYNIKDLKPTSVCLEKECTRTGNIAQVKKLVNMGIKPTTKSLENSCCHKNNMANVKYLVEQGAEPNLECIKNIARSLGNRTLDFIISEYEKTLIKTVKNENNIKNNTKQSNAKKNGEKSSNIKKKLQYLSDENIDIHGESSDDQSTDNESSDNQSVDENIQVISDYEDDVLNDDSSESTSSTDSDEQLFSDPEPETDSDSETDSDYETSNKSKTKKKNVVAKDKKKMSKTDSEIDSDSETSNKSKTKKTIVVKGKKKMDTNNSNISISSNKSKEKSPNKVKKENEPVRIKIDEPKIKIDQRTKIIMGSPVQKMFNLKKGEVMSFLDLRRRLLDYFNKNSLYYEKNKLLIKIDKKIADSLKLEENKYLHFDDLDNLIYKIMDK